MNTLCDVSRSTLIVIDLQERLMPAIHEGSEVISRARILAHAAKILDVPVIGTAQSPSRLGPNVPEITEFFDQTIDKDDFDACMVAGFLKALPESRDELIVLGCEAHVCVLQTVLGLLDRDNEVKLIADAVGSRRSFDKAVALDRAIAAGAEILTSEMVIFEWLRDSNHPKFRQILELIK
jgi:nicotinamidase-related amidase